MQGMEIASNGKCSGNASFLHGMENARNGNAMNHLHYYSSWKCKECKYVRKEGEENA